MRVYVALFHGEMTGTDVVGVFSSLKQAQDAAEAASNTAPSASAYTPGKWVEGVGGRFWIRDLYAGREDGDGLEVQEWTVDEQPSALKPHDRKLDAAVDQLLRKLNAPE
jgi:hypothetical protein